MSWLIESYLEEEMKTAEDFKKKKEAERDKQIDDQINTVFGNRGNDEKSIDVVNKNRGSVWNMKDSTAARMRAADAVERHDRRHPDRKLAESSSDIVEILQ